MKRLLWIPALVVGITAAAYAAGEYPDPTVGDIVAPAGGSSVGDANTLTLNATGTLKYSGRAQALSPADGVLRVANNADGAPTSLAAGIQIGSATVGASLVYDATNGFRSMNFNRTANWGFAGSAFILTNADGTIKYGIGTTGMAPTSTTLSFSTNGSVAFVIDASQNASFTKAIKVVNATVRSGTGAPEGVVTGAVGDIFLRTDGGAGTSLYVKESGAGNTGWIGK